MGKRFKLLLLAFVVFAFGQTAWAETVTLTSSSEDVELHDGDVLTGTGGANTHVTVVDGATVTLRNVTNNSINDNNWFPGIACLGDATIILEGNNALKGTKKGLPGLTVASGKTLTIRGNGTLTANSAGSAAGIGAGDATSCGNIVIESGTIYATGGRGSAGIGAGYSKSCGNITISGGTITATGGNWGAGIGAGEKTGAYCGNIVISGGTVTATSGFTSAGIGGGDAGGCGNITISNGIDIVVATVYHDGYNCIGSGGSGSCGTITIDPSLQDVTEGNTRTLKLPLQQDADGYYLLGTLQNWRDFVALVNGGTANANARMTADIHLGDDQTRIGSTSDSNSALHYQGVFDGQGHKLTIAYVETGVSNLCAPFNKLDGATVRNLHIKGTIHTAGIHGAGVASDSRGTTLIDKVWVEVDVTSTHSGWDECSGIVGCMKAGNLTISDCLFTGSITASSSYNGGFIGYKDSGSASVTNCLSTGTFNYTNSQDFLRGATATNSYYTQFVGSVGSMILTTSAQLADGTIAFKLQQNRADLVWGQRIGIDAAPVLTSDESYRVYRCINGGYTNDPDLAYTGLEQDTENYYLLGSEWAWIDFAALVNGGTTNANARMTADIDLGNDQTVIGSTTVSTTAHSLGSGAHYQGIFDGQGHTLTVAYNATGSNSASPFSSIEGATIKNLHIDGTMISPLACGAGVASATGGNGNVIQNVWVSTTITANGQSWNCSAGIVGCVKNGSVSIIDCLFTGSVTSSQSHNGCFVGYIDSGSATVTNCLSIANFTYNGTSGFMGNYTNCYVKQFPSSIPAAMQVSNDDLADGTTASALQNSRPETIWVQDPVLNQPMLKIFANYVNHVTGYGDSEKSDHWVFIASPVAGNLLPTAVENLVAATATNYDLYRFNQSGANGEWENYKAHTDGFVLENGKGYLYANKNDANLTFAGVLNLSASMEVPLDYDDGARFAGFNLVGNPFTEEATIDMPFYKMNNDGSDVVAVVNYNEEAIPALTGVIVEATDEEQHVTFTKAGAKSRGNSDSQGSLQMTLTKAGVRGNAFHDKAIVSFNEGAQLGKYIFNENHAKLYIPQDGNDYAIAFSNRQGEMPVHFVAKETGRYTISVETHDRASLQGVKLIDKFENVVIDLGIENSYTFIGTPADSRDRFIIRFENSENSESSDFAYQNGTDIIVNGEGELQVFDIMGRMVAKQQINGVQTMCTSSLRTGVYIMRLNEKSQKIVIK